MSANNVSSLAPLDPSIFAWTQLPNGSPLWERRPCGSEVALINLSNFIEQGYYLPAHAQTTAHIDGRYCLQDLKGAARAAWRLLRYEEPQIAANAIWDQQNRHRLMYRVPQGESEVNSWLDNTILVEASNRDLLQLEAQSEHHRKRNFLHPEMTAKIYIGASVLDQSTPLQGASVRFLFQINPLFFDPVGFRCMIASFFRTFVLQLSTSDTISPTHLEWDKSAGNLRPAFINLLAPEQYASTPEFRASAEAFGFGKINFHRAADYTQDDMLRKDPTKITELLISAAKQSRAGFEEVANTPYNMNITASMLDRLPPGSQFIAQPVCDPAALLTITAD
ncbi:MAG: hypothetical protein Q9168_008009 [Polycauliona sp. 1 TL-2023]